MVVVGMSLQIYLAHSGQRLQAEPISFASPDALKSWIENQVSLPTDRQILITGRGKNVRQQSLLTETEVFVYDKQYISPSSEQHPVQNPLPKNIELHDPPTSLANETSIQAWRDLFKARRDWANELVEEVAPYRSILFHAIEETDIIQRASSLAFENLQSHVRNIHNKFEDTRSWARGAIADHDDTLRDWKGNLRVLDKVPAKYEFAFLLQRPQTPTKRRLRRGELLEDETLRAFINAQDVEKAAFELRVANTEFKDRMEELDGNMADIEADTRQVEAGIRSSMESFNLEEIQSIYSDVEALTKKIASDYEELLRLPDNQKSVSTASRRALIHTRDLLPSLQNLAAEISENAQQATQQRNSCLQASTRALQTISMIQSALADFQSQVSKLGLTSEGVEAYDIVRSVFDLPVAYGSTMVESFRRHEWSERIASNADQITQDFKSSRDEEYRRRKKWKKSMGSLINDVSDELDLGIEMSVTTPQDSWPTTDRQEVFEYIKALQNAQIDGAAQHITLLLKQLESVKAQGKIARAFKNGSVYDAELALEQSSSLLEDGDKAVRALRSERSRLEDKLKASDSRVRKLEDLLHRQTQMNRPSSVNFGTLPLDLDRPPQSPTGLPSPRPSELISRRSSVSSRRLSSNNNPDEKTLIQRIVGLEADLRVERDTVTKLQREAQVDRRASTEERERMNEAESTKKDLLANLEAQRQEFDEERQLLDDEMHKLKIRLEEMEDELDRVLGSRDHQRMISDKNIIDLQAQLEGVRKDSSEETARAQEQADFLKNDFVLQKKRAEGLDKQLQLAKEEFSTLQNQNLSLADQLRDTAEAQAEHVFSLQAAHSHLSPGGPAPDDLGRLARAVEILSEGIAIHARNVDEAAQLASAENKSLEEQITQTKTELERVKDKLTAEEMESFGLRETLAQERGKLLSLRTELSHSQTELKNVRTRFAAGETGSEALKERLSEKERRVVELTEKLAIADSDAKTFGEEIAMWKDKVQSLTEESKHWKDRLDVRGVRAKDLSQRLLSNNDRMIRMLEQMGYSVIRQDDKMIIQRASKVNASTVFTADGSMSMIRSLSGQSPTQHYSNVSDLDTLYWMSDSDTTSEEVRFQSFISTLSRLDTEAAADMIAKRYKDVETLARKYQKDSRAYREKAHRLQGEAHDKIAYRSFKEGDLALFLPTRDQATRPWAAFNVGAPHYFLREQDIHKLQTRDWLLARISRVEERVVDLSRSLTNGHHNLHASSVHAETSDHGSTRSADDENPFELSDGLRWYMIDASEEKPGTAPVLTPGLGKSTVAATNVDAKGSIRLTKEGKRVRDLSGSGSAAIATKTLSKSLDSRRSSSGSKKGHAVSPSLGSNAIAGERTGAAGTENAQGESSRPHSSSAAHFQPTGTRPADGEIRAQVKPADGDAEEHEQAREDAPIFEAGPQRQSIHGGQPASESTPSRMSKRKQQQSRVGSVSGSASASPTKAVSTQQQQQQQQKQQQQQQRRQSPTEEALGSSLEYGLYF